MEKNLKLDSNLKSQLSKAAVLHMVLEKGHELDRDLGGANRALKEIMSEGLDELWVIEKKKYEITRKGELVWENWKARWWDLIVNYDVFSGVDLLEGRFADEMSDFSETDENGQNIWEDLRVAVCLRKIQLQKNAGKNSALSPFVMVFLSLLADGRLDHSREWQFDIAFDSIFWNEIENIVNTNYWPEELGHDSDSWENVMDDIIGQGMVIQKERGTPKNPLRENPENIPDKALQNEQEVRDEYDDDLDEYGYDPGYFYYEPYWTWRDTAMTVGAVGLCWAIFS